MIINSAIISLTAFSLALEINKITYSHDKTETTSSSQYDQNVNISAVGLSNYTANENKSYVIVDNAIKGKMIGLLAKNDIFYIMLNSINYYRHYKSATIIVDNDLFITHPNENSCSKSHRRFLSHMNADKITLTKHLSFSAVFSDY